MITLAVLQVLLGYDSERRFIRNASKGLKKWFPYIPQHSGYNKRLRRVAATMRHVITDIARDCPCWHDDIWCVDSTPVECGRSEPPRSTPTWQVGPNCGYCAAYSRYFWGLRLHVITTPAGLPITFAVTGAKADEREICLDMLQRDRLMRPGQILISGNRYRSAEFETILNDMGMIHIRPAAKNEKPRPGKEFLRPFRQSIKAVFGQLKSQLSLERPHTHTCTGVFARILQHILAYTATF